MAHNDARSLELPTADTPKEVQASFIDKMPRISDKSNQSRYNQTHDQKSFLSQTQEIYRVKQAEIVLNEKNHFNLVISQNQSPLLNQLEFKYNSGNSKKPESNKKYNQKLLSKGLFELH